MAITRIRKRNAALSDFQPEKITAAIQKAGEASGEFGRSMAEVLTGAVLERLHHCMKGDYPTVEEVQDVVEDVLLASTFKKTAKAYILYRDQHSRMREIVQTANVGLVDSYLNRLDWLVKENSNMNFSLQGLNNFVASEVSKLYWMHKIYPPEIGQAHRAGDFHIHDLNALSVYCVGWDLQGLLLEGFRGAEGKVESSPAKHFRSALGQIVNFFYTLQGEAAGAQAFSNFDTLLAPYIRYDALEYVEVRQAMQEFVFNINVPTRVGFQTPFTNLTLDLKCPEMLRNTPVVRGGEPQKETYGEFQAEMDMLNRAFLEVMKQGDAKGRVFTFPIPTYNITRDFEWDNPNLKDLWETTAKYGVPYFANFVNSDMSPEDARSMCCRLRLDLRSLDKRGGGLFGANPLTGSIGVVTINLPRLGYEAVSEEDFFKRLEKRMLLARDSLEIKRKVLERYTEVNLYPYSKFYLRNIKQRFGQYWSNHFSTIGIIGMNEACRALLGASIADPKGHEFAARTLDFMREKLREFQEESGCLYNLEATPAEGTSFRLAQLDREKYPDIPCANDKGCRTGGKPFYTNSTQLPVNYTDDLFEALDLQDGLQTRYTGGTVFHGFLGERMVSGEAAKRLVRKVMENYHLPYFTLTPTFSICPVHGYLDGEHEYCPKCDAEIEATNARELQQEMLQTQGGLV